MGMLPLVHYAVGLINREEIINSYCRLFYLYRRVLKGACSSVLKRELICFIA